tara:strand:+ start:1778 stop:2461 length:684 start_codon:yes stop_codon:yes gene_type:complete
MERIKKPKSIAIIPARGGSKRLPRKNILPLNGIPLLTRVIRVAKKSSIFDEIIVSTEDEEISNIAKKEDITIHNRSTKLASDYASVTDACIEVLSKRQPDVFCCIYATAALISIKTLRQSSKKFLSDKSSNVLMGVSKYNFHPVQALSLSKNGIAKMLFPNFEKIKSQKFPTTRVSNGTFYWARLKNFSKEKTFYSKKLRLFDVPENETCDINTLADYKALIEKIKY